MSLAAFTCFFCSTETGGTGHLHGPVAVPKREREDLSEPTRWSVPSSSAAVRVSISHAVVSSRFDGGVGWNFRHGRVDEHCDAGGVPRKLPGMGVETNRRTNPLMLGGLYLGAG